MLGGAGVDDRKGLIRADVGTDLGELGQADGRVDRVLRSCATAAERDDREPDGPGVDRRHATRVLGGNRHLDVGPFEIPIWVFDEVGRAAESGDHLGELLHGSAVEGGFDLRPPVSDVGRQRRQHEHLGTERDDHVVHARLAPGAREVLDRVHDLDGVAGR